MLPQPLCWDAKTEHVIYSQPHKDLRKIYMYDIFTEMSGPINFHELPWFEFERINDSQIIIHGWKKGIYVHDIEEKHSQKLVNVDDNRWFKYQHTSKTLLYSSGNNIYFFEPKTKKSQLLVKQSAELIIDPVHKTFISVSDGLNPSVDIYYKNESIISFKNGFNIVCNKDFTSLVYFSEDIAENRSTLHLINLETLKEEFSYSFDGIVQSVNCVDDVIHFSQLNHTIYEFYLFPFKEKEVQYIDSRKSDFQIYSSLSENIKYIALMHDVDGNSHIELIELENAETNLLN